MCNNINDGLKVKHKQELISCHLLNTKQKLLQNMTSYWIKNDSPPSPSHDTLLFMWLVFPNLQQENTDQYILILSIQDMIHSFNKSWYNMLFRRWLQCMCLAKLNYNIFIVKLTFMGTALLKTVSKSTALKQSSETTRGNVTWVLYFV